MTETLLHVRLPGHQAHLDVLVSSNATPTEAVRTIAALYTLSDVSTHSLVISPTTSKSGGILDAHTPLHKFHLLDSDVLELWKSPFVIQLAVQTPSGKPTHVKRLALDCDSPLTNLIPIVQTCFESDVGNDEFGFQQCVLAADGTVGATATWLNANESLMQQRFAGEFTLLIVPMQILARMPAKTLSQKAAREGWLYKESHKNNKLTPRKCRYCIVRSAFLFYFKRQNDSHPAGVIPLQYYTVKKVTREPRGNVIVLRRASQAFENGGADAFLFQLYDKSGDSLADWFECIRNRCVNVSDKLFGVPIDRVALATGGDDNVPHFVRACCEFLSQPHVITIEGLFRLSGRANAVAALKDKFDQAQDVTLLGNADVDAHTVTALLKMFFREMPAPLFPFEFYDLMIASHHASKSKEKQLFEMFHTTSQLPRVNYDVLRFLCRFLHSVTTFADRNKMSPDNLARVWASNLLRRRDESQLQQDVDDIDPLNGAMADLIMYHDRLTHLDDKSLRGYRQRAPTAAHIVSIAPNAAVTDDDDEDTLDERRIPYQPPPPAGAAGAAATLRAGKPGEPLQRTLSPRSLAGDLALSLPTPPTSSPVTQPELPTEGEVKSGFLTKQGGQRKNWKSRWFILSLTDLAYFVDNKPRSALKGVIPLKGAGVRVATELRRNHTIAVVTNDRVYYLSADSESVCTAWLNTLTAVVNRLKAPPPPPAPQPQPTAPQNPPPPVPQQQLPPISPRPAFHGGPGAAPAATSPRPSSLNAATPGKPSTTVARPAPLPQVPNSPPTGRATPVQQSDTGANTLARTGSLRRIGVGASSSSAEDAATIRELTQRVAALEKELIVERTLRTDAERRLAEYEKSDTPSARAIDDELVKLTREQAEIDAALGQYSFGGPQSATLKRKGAFDTTI
jgi:hypothetical protein